MNCEQESRISAIECLFPEVTHIISANITSTHISLWKGSHLVAPNFKQMGTCYVHSVPKGRDESDAAGEEQQ